MAMLAGLGLGCAGVVWLCRDPCAHEHGINGKPTTCVATQTTQLTDSHRVARAALGQCRGVRRLDSGRCRVASDRGATESLAAHRAAAARASPMDWPPTTAAPPEMSESPFSAAPIEVAACPPIAEVAARPPILVEAPSVE